MADRFPDPWAPTRPFNLLLENVFVNSKARDLQFFVSKIAHILTPGIPGPMVLCGGLIPPPKF